MADVSLLTLPVELIHRILNNLDAYFIYFFVRKVCKRFYLIVNLYHQYDLNLDSISQSRLKIISRCIQSEKISSLGLKNMYNELEKTKLFLSLFDTSQLTRLQSITLCRADRRTDSEALQHLNISNLVSLNIHSTDPEYDSQLPFISKVMVQPHFRKLRLAESCYNIMRIPWPNRCTITFLTIKSCSLKEYNFLLQRLPYTLKKIGFLPNPRKRFGRVEKACKCIQMLKKRFFSFTKPFFCGTFFKFRTTKIGFVKIIRNLKGFALNSTGLVRNH